VTRRIFWRRVPAIREGGDFIRTTDASAPSIVQAALSANVNDSSQYRSRTRNLHCPMEATALARQNGARRARGFRHVEAIDGQLLVQEPRRMSRRVTAEIG
jgi:hypothetical protein